MILIWKHGKWHCNLSMNHYKYPKPGEGQGMSYGSSGDMTNQKISTTWGFAGLSGQKGWKLRTVKIIFNQIMAQSETESFYFSPPQNFIGSKYKVIFIPIKESHSVGSQRVMRGK